MKILSSSPEATHDLGVKLGSLCEAGEVICLAGDLGAGKTTMVQAIAEGAGVAANEYVNSPTFSILHEYRARMPIYHMDFYRLGSSEDVAALGLDDYFYGDGLTLIEWFERAGDLLPESVLIVELHYADESSREITLYSDAPGWLEKIDNLEKLLARR